ncbi:MAG: hydrogenase maturation nickel metallochaperone HypA [Candidatus Edwardsbacteria bacterium]|nr:hydrogenase maturation nickel metallochaperone HypA [Candidatus Edwardsbacteria bacterium]
MVFYHSTMHELAITQSLLRIALDTAEKNGVMRILIIRLKIGELTGYVPAAVEQNFAMLSPGTKAEGAALVIERIPLQCSCKHCGNAYRARSDDFTCPACGAADAAITGGREMFIESMEVET